MKFKQIFTVLFIVTSYAVQAQKLKVKLVVKDAEKQTETMLQSIAAAKGSNASLIMPRTLENGSLKLIATGDWTSGFFPGELWKLFELTGNAKWKKKADSMTLLLEKEQFNGSSHDVGFKVYCSFGSGYKFINNDTHYKNVIIQAAKTLSKRFNPVVGCIRSWDHNKQSWKYPVIIDNMMNLELLFAATRLSGDSSFYNIAVSHANTTLKNHFRKNFSSYHVIDYDSSNGNILKKVTHQGYADESAWARGQAWGLYGFTMCYRETKNKNYLQQADSIAAFILHHPKLPEDLIPYWDYNDPEIPNVSKDVSAATVTASALYELSYYSEQGKWYRKMADKIMLNLTNNYRSAVGENKGFILLHSTGHRPAGSEVDVPLNYADYYYLEALVRSKQ
jgi:hypothetical protein